MAITVKTGGVFTKEAGDRPGLYVRFIEKAIATIGVGARAKVATIKTQFNGTATGNTVYRITRFSDAEAYFGEENIKDIQYMFQGGASEVVVVTTEGGTDLSATAINAALGILETYDFHIFVCPTNSAIETEVLAWTKANEANGKEFVSVFATSEETVEQITAKTNTASGNAAVVVANGVLDADGEEVSAELYASYIAGLIAGMTLDGSLTYYEVPFTGVITRFRAPEIKELLAAGALVTVMDGDQPRIEQGLTTGEAPFNKIRTIRARQAMVADIDTAVNDNYIGKITNNEDGQIAVINAIKAYLQTLADGNVIDAAFTVELDKTQASIGADLYINIAVQFLDSIEYVYLTITV